MGTMNDSSSADSLVKMTVQPTGVVPSVTGKLDDGWTSAPRMW